MAWQAQAVAAHHLLERTPFGSPESPGMPSKEWAEAHRDFHIALMAACRTEGC
jgi:hypothetical protein